MRFGLIRKLMITMLFLNMLSSSNAQGPRGSLSRGPYSPLAYGASGSYRSTASGMFGFSGRNYAYGNYGAYQGMQVIVRPVNPSPPPTPIAVASALPIANASAATPTIVSQTPNSPYYYGTPGYPSTFYQPNVQSYAPYATPGVGYQPGRAPVYAATYGNGMTLGQSYTGYSNAAPAALNAQLGYPSYVNNRGSFGQDLFPGLAPGQVTYGQSSQAASTPPGYYGNYLAPAGATYNQIISGSYPAGTQMPMGPPPVNMGQPSH